VESLLPPGSDPHHFSLTGEDIEMLKKAELIILANSQLFSFEEKIKTEFPNKVLDFPDYNATLDNFPGYRQNPHGYWLKPENAIGIARAVAMKLSEMHPENRNAFLSNYMEFEARVINAKKEAGRIASDLSGKEFVAMVPGVCYIASSLNITIAAVMLSEGSGFVSGTELSKIKELLKKGKYVGIIVPEFMKGGKGGEIAEQLAKDTGCRIAYVKFSMGDSDYPTLLISNAARIAYSTRYVNDGYDNLTLYALAGLCLIESAILFFWRLRS
jgi:zinc/manganese transport system substrate-binding protein